MRITDKNLTSYVLNEYNSNILYQTQKTIDSIKPLLQNNFGQDYDCSLTSITNIISWLKPNINVNDIYNKVEQIAKNYLYNGKTIGTLPFFIKPIFNNSLKHFKINKNTGFKCIKNVGFNFNFIKEQINNENPMILSLLNDGRNFYKNHSVTIIGYNIIKTSKQTLNMILVYDNWSKTISYIDYNKLNIISSINF